jgi:hypothetical protein
VTTRNARELAARRYVDRWCVQDTSSLMCLAVSCVTVRSNRLEAVRTDGSRLVVIATAPGWVSLARELGWDGRVTG